MVEDFTLEISNLVNDPEGIDILIVKNKELKFNGWVSTNCTEEEFYKSLYNWAKVNNVYQKLTNK